MDIYEEILCKEIGEAVLRYIQQTPMDFQPVVETRALVALQKIKAIIEDDSLADSDCFMQIEEIIRVFEEIGSNGGNRHD